MIDIQKEKDGNFTAFLRDKNYAWTGAISRREAIMGLASLYPEVRLTEEYEDELKQGL